MQENNSSAKEALQGFQKTIVSYVLFAIALLAFIPVAMLFFGADSPHASAGRSLQIGAYALVLFLLLLRRYLPAQVLALQLIIISIILAIIVMYFRGFISVGPFYLLVAIGVAAGILEKSSAHMILIVSALCILLVPLLYLTGNQPDTQDLMAVITAPSFIWVRAFTYIFFFGVLFFVIAKMREFMLNFINDLEAQSLSLRQVNEELTASEEEIRMQIEALTNKDAQLHQISFYDRLTGLPNREHFIKRTTDLFANKQPACLAIFIIDLDGLNKINNSLGHAAGDAILREMALRMSVASRCAGGEEFFARLGGDEFVLTCCPSGEDDLAATAAALIDTVNQPTEYNDNTVLMTACIGAAVFPQHGISFEELIKKADTALYSAKSEGTNTFTVFNEAMKSDFDQRISLETALTGALTQKEIYASYQPILHPDGKTLRGCEVLMRWHSPRHGQISPAVFIPMLELSKQIIPFGDWILQEACRQAKRWHDSSTQPFIISVNISSVQLLDCDFQNKIETALKLSGLPAQCLELEITESTLIENFHPIVDKLNQLRALGVSLSLDDFGTGYSSLSYLRLLPIDNLKIDQSFVENLDTSNNEASLVGSIISLAHDLKLKVIAEGVETQDQLDYLLAKNCDFLQGFFFSRPVDERAMGTVLVAQKQQQCAD